MKSKIGQQISFQPATQNRRQTGEIVWEHPQGRFVLARYCVKIRFGKVSVLRECLRPGEYKRQSMKMQTRGGAKQRGEAK